MFGGLVRRREGAAKARRSASGFGTGSMARGDLARHAAVWANASSVDLVRRKKTSWVAGVCVALTALVFAVLALLVLDEGAAAQELPEEPEEWQHVAFGDSAGAGASDYVNGEFLGYNKRYDAHVAGDTGHPAALTNRSLGGHTSADVYLTMSLQSSRELMQTSEVVSWDGGGNDLRQARREYQREECGGRDNQNCLRRMYRDFALYWDGMVGFARQNRNPDGAVVLAQTYFYPWVSEDTRRNTTPRDRGSDFDVMSVYLRAMDGYAKQSTEAAGFEYLDLIPLFNGPDGKQDPRLAGLTNPNDPLHSNSAGHKLIADEYRKLGYAPLAP